MRGIRALLTRRSLEGVGLVFLLTLTGLSGSACSLSPGLDTPSLSSGGEDDEGDSGDAGRDGDGSTGAPGTGGGLSSEGDGDDSCAGGAGGMGGGSLSCEEP